MNWYSCTEHHVSMERGIDGVSLRYVPNSHFLGASFLGLIVSVSAYKRKTMGLVQNFVFYVCYRECASW